VPVRQVSVTPRLPARAAKEATFTAVGTAGSGHAYAPRPRVNTARVVAPRSTDMSQIITWGSPFSNRCHTGDAAEMSFVKYRPQSVPAKTWFGTFGLTAIESAGTSGRLPLLSTQVNEAHAAVQVTWKTCPGVVGVFS